LTASYGTIKFAKKHKIQREKKESKGKINIIIKQAKREKSV
jgi:hypothetical protein